LSAILLVLRKLDIKSCSSWKRIDIKLELFSCCWQHLLLIRIGNDILDPFIAFLRITINIKQLWGWQRILNYNYLQVFRDSKKKDMR
jgi:hypothetical protein